MESILSENKINQYCVVIYQIPERQGSISRSNFIENASKSLLYISPQLYGTFPWNYTNTSLPVSKYHSDKALNSNCRNPSSCLDSAKSPRTFYLVFGNCFGERGIMVVYLVHYCIKLYSDILQ